jgi:hypothetical protein
MNELRNSYHDNVGLLVSGYLKILQKKTKWYIYARVCNRTKGNISHRNLAIDGSHNNKW